MTDEIEEVKDGEFSEQVMSLAERYRKPLLFRVESEPTQGLSSVRLQSHIVSEFVSLQRAVVAVTADDAVVDYAVDLNETRADASDVVESVDDELLSLSGPREGGKVVHEVAYFEVRDGE